MSKSTSNLPRDPTTSGLLYALASFLLWGMGPAFFNLLRPVPAFEILAHRIVWSVLLMAIIVAILRRPNAVLAELRSWRRLGTYTVTTTLVSANWLIYIWAVNNGHIVESSLGYYINPLVNVLLGVIFLSERLSSRQGVAVVLAMLGVGSMIIGLGTLPWIALVLALSFGFYALIRKKAGVDPLVGLLVETAIVAPVAVGYLVWAELAGTGAFGRYGPGFDLLLMSAGIFTATPLILFMYGAQRLKLSTIGLMQYIAPTMQLLLGVLLFGEAFTTGHAVAFGFIWAGLLVFSSEAIFRTRRAAQPAAE